MQKCTCGVPVDSAGGGVCPVHGYTQIKGD